MDLYTVKYSVDIPKDPGDWLNVHTAIVRAWSSDHARSILKSNNPTVFIVDVTRWGVS